MTAGSPKSFRLFAVVALKRPDLSETVIAWRRDEGQARRLAGQYMVAVAHEFVRCRVQSVQLTLAQIQAICFRWGQEDARSGASVPNTLPGVYGREYRRGYETARQASGTATRGAPNATGPSEETR